MKKPKQFIPRFLAFRRRNKLTQDECARLANVTRRAICFWDDGMIPRKKNRDAFVLATSALKQRVVTVSEVFGR